MSLPADQTRSPVFHEGNWFARSDLLREIQPGQWYEDALGEIHQYFPSVTSLLQTRGPGHSQLAESLIMRPLYQLPNPLGICAIPEERDKEISFDPITQKLSFIVAGYSRYQPAYHQYLIEGTPHTLSLPHLGIALEHQPGNPADKNAVAILAFRLPSPPGEKPHLRVYTAIAGDINLHRGSHACLGFVPRKISVNVAKNLALFREAIVEELIQGRHGKYICMRLALYYGSPEGAETSQTADRLRTRFAQIIED